MKYYFVRKITQRYLLALGLLVVFALTAYSFLQWAIEMRADDAARINVSGRQRMLSQRIARYCLELALYNEDSNARDALREELLTAISLIEKSHDGLIHGDAQMKLLPRRMSKEIEKLFFTSPLLLDLQVRWFLKEARMVMNINREAVIAKDNPHLRYVLNVSRHELLDGLDAAVMQYEKEAEHRIGHLKDVETLILISALVIIIIIGLFIFRPMTREMTGNIKEIERKEIALQEINQLLKSIIQTSPLAIITLDNNNSVNIWNAAAERMFGWTKEEVWEKSLPIIPKDKQIEFVELFSRARSNESFSHEIDCLKKTSALKDGAPIIADISLSPLYDAANNIIGITMIAADITLRKGTEAILTTTCEFNDNILRTIPFGMDIVDQEGTILYANEKLKSIAGEGAVGKKCFTLYKDDKQQCPDCPLKKEIAFGKTEMLEVKGVFGGRIFRISHTGMHYNNRPAILELFEDVTVEKQAEEELRKALGIKSEFISMVSHELRTPLTAIKEGIAIVLDGSAGPINAEQKEFLDIAGRNVFRLARFINEVLDYQKLDAGKMEYRMEESGINELVEETRLEMLPQAESKGLELIIFLDRDLPKICLDRDRIMQVLVNLVNNAIKFTNQGRVEITTSKMENAVCVSIADTGIGIKKEDADKLFRSFSQVAIGKERKTGSTGLGLAISEKIISQHGGKIWFESEYGRGSVFSFILPISERRGECGKNNSGRG